MNIINIIKPFLNYRGRLSEGPTYNPNNNTLLWVDIIAGELHRVFLSNTNSIEYTNEELLKTQESHEVFLGADEYFGVVYLTNNDDIVLIGGKRGISEYNFQTKNFKYKFKYDDNDDKLRSNDGNIDPNGNIWQGLMGSFEYGPINEGKLIKITPDGTITNEVSNVLIPNGINWSKDGKTLYWTSSLEFIIYKFDFDLEKSTISNKQPHIKIKEFLPDFESPEPDGFAISESGDIYTAVFSTSLVLHFNNKGELVEQFKFPAKRITSVAFGGVDKDELFITSANLHLDDETKLDENPEDLGGAIFRIKLGNGVKGVLKPSFKI